LSVEESAPARPEWRAKLRGRRLVVLALLLPIAVALHVYLVWLGGGWRIFALAELGVGAFVALAMREAKRIDGAG
jgi:hypothetical protein